MTDIKAVQIGAELEDEEEDDLALLDFNVAKKKKTKKKAKKTKTEIAALDQQKAGAQCKFANSINFIRGL